jgi:hypothetical protein
MNWCSSDTAVATNAGHTITAKSRARVPMSGVTVQSTSTRAGWSTAPLHLIPSQVLEHLLAPRKATWRCISCPRPQLAQGGLSGAGHSVSGAPRAWHRLESGSAPSSGAHRARGSSRARRPSGDWRACWHSSSHPAWCGGALWQHHLASGSLRGRDARLIARAARRAALPGDRRAGRRRRGAGHSSPCRSPLAGRLCGLCPVQSRCVTPVSSVTSYARCTGGTRTLLHQSGAFCSTPCTCVLD